MRRLAMGSGAQGTALPLGHPTHQTARSPEIALLIVTYLTRVIVRRRRPRLWHFTRDNSQSPTPASDILGVGSRDGAVPVQSGAWIPLAFAALLSPAPIVPFPPPIRTGRPIKVRQPHRSLSDPPPQRPAWPQVAHPTTSRHA